MSDTWYSYECAGPTQCATPTGVVLDVRVPWSPDGGTVPEVSCPICHHPMRFRGSWAATEGGFGSRGDHPDFAKDAVDAWLEEWATNIVTACAEIQKDGTALACDLPPLSGKVSYGAFADEIRRRKATVPLSTTFKTFMAEVEHLGHCEYRNGFYDESRRCDCGLVTLRNLARKP